MKKILIITFLFLLLVGSFAQAEEPQINVKVDPRIELLTVVQVLSDYDVLTNKEFNYQTEMEDYFSEYRNHSAVKLFKKMRKGGFSYDAPPAVMLYLSEPSQLKIERQLTDYLKRRAGGERRLKRFIKELRDFAEESNFMAFYEEHSEFYQDLVNQVKNKTKGENYAVTLEDYYGNKQKSYNIILAPLFHPGGYGPRIKEDKLTYSIYNICGPIAKNNGQPDFGSSQRFKYLAWHEFSHSFINPLTAQHSKQVNKYSELLKPIADKMKQQAYGNWETVVNEHIVRAVTARLSYLKEGKQAAEQALAKEKQNGFIYIDALYKALARYENNRDEYSSITEFYPELIQVFAKMDVDEIVKNYNQKGFMGPINNVFRDRDSIVFVYPTNEKNKKIEKKILDYIKQMRNKFFPKADLISDKKALQSDLSQNSIITYGTEEGNLWLENYLNQIPLQIKSDRLIADQEYKGENLLFISAWPNPSNAENGVLIYSAQRPKI